MDSQDPLHRKPAHPGSPVPEREIHEKNKNRCDPEHFHVGIPRNKITFPTRFIHAAELLARNWKWDSNGIKNGSLGVAACPA